MPTNLVYVRIHKVCDVLSLVDLWNLVIPVRWVGQVPLLCQKKSTLVNKGDQKVGGGFFLTCEDCLKRLKESFWIPHLPFPQVEISLCENYAWNMSCLCMCVCMLSLIHI